MNPFARLLAAAPTRRALVPIALKLAVVGLYVLGLCYLISVLSFWLDEIIQLSVVEQRTIGGFLGAIAKNPGSAPLGYLAERITVWLFGLNPAGARLPALLSGLLACVGVLSLAKAFKIKLTWLPVFLFAMFPLQIRYSTEARPYSQALLFTIWATLYFVKYLEDAKVVNLLTYLLLSVGAIYSQPYSAFIILGHVAYLCLSRDLTGGKLVKVQAALAAVFALLSFLPWLLFMKNSWAKSLEHQLGSITLKSPLLLMKELVGAGYTGTFLIIIAAAFGAQAIARPSLLLLLATLPVIGACALDLLAGYFLAIRQVIFVLPYLALLAASGLESMARTRHLRTLGVFIGVAIIIGDLYSTNAWLHRTREDWKRPSAILLAANPRMNCFLSIPEMGAEYYEAVSPGISTRLCSESRVTTSPSIFLSFRRNTTDEHDSMTRKLAKFGFKRRELVYDGDPSLELFRRDLNSSR